MKSSKGDSKQSGRSDPAKTLTRQQRCEDSASRELKDGKDSPPGPRGACAKTSKSQGSE